MAAPTAPAMCMTLAEYEAAVAHDDRVAKQRKYFDWIAQRREPIVRAKLAAIRELRELEHLEEVVLAPSASARRRPASARPTTSKGSPRLTATPPVDPSPVPAPAPPPPPAADSPKLSPRCSSSGTPRERQQQVEPVAESPKKWRPLSAGCRREVFIPLKKPCIPLEEEEVIESSRVVWKDWRPSRMPRPFSAQPRASTTQQKKDPHSPSPPPPSRDLKPRPDPTLDFNSGQRVRTAWIGRPPTTGPTASSLQRLRRRATARGEATAIQQNSVCGIVGKILAADGKISRGNGEEESEPGDLRAVSRFGPVRSPCCVNMAGSTSTNRQAASRERALALRLKAAERLWSLKKEVLTIGRL